MDKNKQKSPQGCVHSKLIDSLKQNGMTLLQLSSTNTQLGAYSREIQGLTHTHTHIDRERYWYIAHCLD